MAALSGFLSLAIVVLFILGVVAIRHDDWHTGLKYIVWALIPLTLLLGLAWRVQCRVKTTRSKPCGNEAYGLLFGCTKTPRHWWGKFSARLGWQREAEYVGQRRGQQEVMYQLAPGKTQAKLTVEDSMLAKCASWATLASAVIAVIGILIQVKVL
jgi:hypothetical protein